MATKAVDVDAASSDTAMHSLCSDAAMLSRCNALAAAVAASGTASKLFGNRLEAPQLLATTFSNSAKGQWWSEEVK